jgi:hypothetical protein
MARQTKHPSPRTTGGRTADYDVVESRPGLGIGACLYAAVIREADGSEWPLPGRYNSSAAALKAAKAAIKSRIER